MTNYKTYIKFLLVIIVLAFTIKYSLAQDIHFSQYNQAPMQMNPALTGTDDSYARCNLNYRNQWAVFGNAYHTAAFSYDMPFLKKSKSEGSFIGVGIHALYDKAGITKLTKLNAGLSASGVVTLSKNHFMSVGFQATYNQRSINNMNVKWDNQFDGVNYNPALPSNESTGALSKIFFDYAAGFALVKHGNLQNMDKNDDFGYTFSSSVYHFTRPNQGLQGADKINMRFVNYLMMSFGTSSNISIHPIAAYFRQGTIHEINAGCFVKYTLKQETTYTGYKRGSAIGVGAYYRFMDAIYPTVMYEVSDYAFGLSYDFNVSGLTKWTGARGGFEIVFTYRDLNGLLFGNGDKHIKFY
jgi:type IX secretion system PorP/SprF family membrane protein